MNKLYLISMLFLFFCCSDRKCEISNKTIDAKSVRVIFNILKLNEPAYYSVKKNDENFLSLEDYNFEYIIGCNRDSAAMLLFRLNPYVWEDNKYWAKQYKKWYNSKADLDTLKSALIKKIYTHNADKIRFKVDLLRIEVGKDEKDSCIITKAYFTRLNQYPLDRIIEYSETKYYRDFFYELQYWFPVEDRFKNEKFIDCLFEKEVVGQIAGRPKKWN